MFFLFFACRLFASFDTMSIPDLEKTIIDDPENKEALLQLGIKYSVEKQYLKAVEKYFSLLKIDPENFHAYNNLGIVYKKVGQFKDSLFCYQKALKINPDYYWIHYNIGLVFESMGRMQEAREAYGKALSLNPEFSQALQRLRDLSESTGKVPNLPAPPSIGILVVDSPDRQPVLKSLKGPPAPIKKDPSQTTDLSRSNTTKIETERKPTPEKKPASFVKSTREGPGKSFYQKSMDYLKKEDLPNATEQYVRCILVDREFLAEPDNGLIQKTLDLLEDRPNSMSDGLFFRGFLQSMQGKRDKSLNDLKTYLVENPKGPFWGDGKKIVDRFEAEIAALEASQRAKEAATRFSSPPTIALNATYTPRPDESSIKKMTVDEVLEQAKQLAREGRQRDAIVTLRTSLDHEPNNPKLLLAAANTYTDLLLLNGDMEAGKMAREIFEKILTVVASDSKEAGIAQSMVKELSGRIR
ncbi:tetratricopeptide repeat protein [bacterium]|nr:tetratricopeptide repeat protein [bacterium]